MSGLGNGAGMIEVRLPSLALALRAGWRLSERGCRRRALPHPGGIAPGAQDNILRTVAFEGGGLSWPADAPRAVSAGHEQS